MSYDGPQKAPSQAFLLSFEHFFCQSWCFDLQACPPNLLLLAFFDQANTPTHSIWFCPGWCYTPVEAVLAGAGAEAQWLSWSSPCPVNQSDVDQSVCSFRPCRTHARERCGAKGFLTRFPRHTRRSKRPVAASTPPSKQGFGWDLVTRVP